MATSGKKGAETDAPQKRRPAFQVAGRFFALKNFKRLFLLGRDELVALAVDVDDFDLRIVFQVLAQLGDIDVHRAGVEVVVVDPDGFQGEVALQDFVGMRAEQRKEFVFLRGELAVFVADGKQLLLGVESEFSDVVEGAFLVFLSTYATQNSLNAEHELFHREGLGDVVVGTDFEAFDDVVLLRLCRQEDDGHFGVGLADFLGQRKTVFLRHHHVEHADVELTLQEGLEACLAVGTELGHVAFGL